MSNNVSNDVVLSLNVLSFFMISWIFGLFNCSTIVENNVMGTCSILIIPRLEKNFLSHKASFAISQATTYSASMVESAIQDFLVLLQLMAPPPKVNTYPEMDFLKSRFD